MLSFSYIISGQNLFTGRDNKYGQNYTLNISIDSSIILISANESLINYREYTGDIRKINDTLFNINR